MGELMMKKIVQYGMLLVGSVLCLYSPISRTISKYYQQNHVQEQHDRMGRIEISKIDVDLPIFLGTSEDVLQKGVGYMKESSLPGSGKSTHSLLAGHRGLPSGELFFRLNELKEGDSFVIYTSGKELYYEVCDVQVIRPEETDVLQVQKEKELVSLITCTPYGINTHRLIVTGERKEKNE